MQPVRHRGPRSQARLSEHHGERHDWPLPRARVDGGTHADIDDVRVSVLWSGLRREPWYLPHVQREPREHALPRVLPPPRERLSCVRAMRNRAPPAALRASARRSVSSLRRAARQRRPPRWSLRLRHVCGVLRDPRASRRALDQPDERAPYGAFLPRARQRSRKKTRQPRLSSVPAVPHGHVPTRLRQALGHRRRYMHDTRNVVRSGGAPRSHAFRCPRG